MKRKLLRTFEILCITIFAFTIFSLFLGIKSVKADSSVGKNAELVSPATSIEYNEIKNPAFISYANGKIFLTNNTNTLFVYDLENKTSKRVSFENNLNKAIFNNSLNKALVLEAETLYSLDLSTNQKTKIDKTTARNFSISNDNVIVISGNDIKMFNSNFEQFSIVQNVIGTSIILCSDSENVYYSNNGTTINKYCYSGEFETTIHNFINNDNTIPSAMVSDGEFLYYVVNNIIYKKNINTTIESKLTIDATPFELGSLGAIKSICLKDNNLLIASTFENGKSAIQEFRVNENKLEFTGFAISKGNSAFNRIDSNATDIDKNGNNIAVIDSQKITLLSKNENEYTYKNILINSEFIGANKIALGKNEVLIATDDKYAFADLESYTIATAVEMPNIKDIAFVNNNYYILTCDTEDSENPIATVYQYKDDNFVQIDTKAESYSSFTINAKNEIIYSTKSKIANDLIGTEFSLDSFRLKDYVGLKSFAMDIESKEVYFLINDSEQIVSSTEFDNKTISEIEIKSDYKTTDIEAKAIEQLKVYNIKDNSNVYSIQIDKENRKITYNGLTDDHNGDFVNVYSLADAYDGFSILSGFNNSNREILILINNNDIIEKENIITNYSKQLVVSTSVDMYYLPLINLNREFSLYNNEYIRLNRGTKVACEKQIEINGKSFVYGKVNIDNNNIAGFIPKDFLVEALDKDYIVESYTFATLSSAKLLNENGVVIYEIKDNTLVKVHKTENDKSYISFTDEFGVHYGFVDNASIIKETNNNLKIVICIFILTFVVFVTTIYFVFIKNKNNYV